MEGFLGEEFFQKTSGECGQDLIALGALALFVCASCELLSVRGSCSRQVSRYTKSASSHFCFAPGLVRPTVPLAQTVAIGVRLPELDELDTQKSQQY